MADWQAPGCHLVQLTNIQQLSVNVFMKRLIHFLMKCTTYILAHPLKVALYTTNLILICIFKCWLHIHSCGVVKKLIIAVSINCGARHGKPDMEIHLCQLKFPYFPVSIKKKTRTQFVFSNLFSSYDIEYELSPKEARWKMSFQQSTLSSSDTIWKHSLKNLPGNWLVFKTKLMSVNRKPSPNNLSFQRFLHIKFVESLVLLAAARLMMLPQKLIPQHKHQVVALWSWKRHFINTKAFTWLIF